MRASIMSILLLALAGCAPAIAQSSWSEAALDDLEATAAAAPLEGLASEEAALTELARFRHASITDAAAEAQTGIAADALFASLARSFAQGGADPARADPDWAIPLADAPNLALLKAAREAGAMPSALLRRLLPQGFEYAALRDELARLRARRDGQTSHIDQVRAALERWRWLHRELPERRIEVRIAQYELRYVAPDEPLAAHSVIVGARSDQTPSFTAEIRSITFNPSWDPPPSIAADLLARFRRDPAAAAREGFEALDANGAAVASVDWSVRPFPYRLRQHRLAARIGG
jgi:L,D-transpeptidase YcbB